MNILDGLLAFNLKQHESMIAMATQIKIEDNAETILPLNEINEFNKSNVTMPTQLPCNNYANEKKDISNSTAKIYTTDSTSNKQSQNLPIHRQLNHEELLRIGSPKVMSEISSAITQANSTLLKKENGSVNEIDQLVSIKQGTVSLGPILEKTSEKELAKANSIQPLQTNMHESIKTNSDTKQQLQEIEVRVTIGELKIQAPIAQARTKQPGIAKQTQLSLKNYLRRRNTEKTYE
jgi:hypothetical protein